MVHCSMWKSWITALPDTPSMLLSPSVGRSGLFDWPVVHGWTRYQLHFPTTWISSPGLSPWYSRHQWSFINASHRPFTLSSLQVIGEMSSTNVNITWVCESGFFREPENGWKHQSPSCFVTAGPTRCRSSSTLNKPVYFCSLAEWKS